MARSKIRLLPLALAAACSCDGGATHGADAGADLIVVDAAADMASACGPDAAPPGEAAGEWRPIASRFHRSSDFVVWTGTEMLVWGGLLHDDLPLSDTDTGDRYDPAVDAWSAMTTEGAPRQREHGTAVWTGSEMIVWGGDSGGPRLGDGGRYDPARDAWSPMAMDGAPSPRRYHVAVWTGAEMIVWGGDGQQVNQYHADGAAYDPKADGWRALPDDSKLRPRARLSAVWTGTEMIVWGGYDADKAFADGARYDPALDTWRAVSARGMPFPRGYHKAVWTGSEMIVWGGSWGGPALNDGARYDPATDTWRSIAECGAPPGRTEHSAVWTGSEMIVWGGRDFGGGFVLGDGARYDPAADAWRPMTMAGAPRPRTFQATVWTGAELIVYGGAPVKIWMPLDDGARFRP